MNLENGEVITCTDEAGVYAALGMQYIPPELRSGLDEIELARAGAIPTLVESDDLRGDFHMHTTWSDGDDTLEAMIAAAAARGYEYHAISDHSRGRGRRFGMGAGRATPAARRDRRAERAHTGFTRSARARSTFCRTVRWTLTKTFSRSSTS